MGIPGKGPEGGAGSGKHVKDRQVMGASLCGAVAEENDVAPGEARRGAKRPITPKFGIFLFALHNSGAGSDKLAPSAPPFLLGLSIPFCRGDHVG